MTRRCFIVALVAMAAHAQAADRLDPTLTIVMGGGLSAGFAGFHLTESAQNRAWPVLAAKQMGAYIAVPAMRETGQAGTVNSYSPLAGLLPRVTQSGERALPFPFFAMNLSVPFLRLGDALRVRPQPRHDGINLITSIEGDLLTTLVNSVLGGPFLVLQPPILLTQIEYAEIMSPTTVFIQLGFEDVVDAAVRADVSRITPAASFTTDYAELLRRVTDTGATVIAMTAPDPLDTAYFSSIADLGRTYGIAPEAIQARFGLAAGDFVTLGGMIEIADALRGRGRDALSSGSVLPASVAAAVRNAVTAYNGAIRTAAQSKKVAVFELGDFLRQIRVSGATAGRVSISGAYLGGFYSEDGLYPNATGQALVTNALLQFLNTTYGSSFRPVAVEVSP